MNPLTISSPPDSVPDALMLVTQASQELGEARDTETVVHILHQWSARLTGASHTWVTLSTTAGLNTAELSGPGGEAFYPTEDHPITAMIEQAAHSGEVQALLPQAENPAWMAAPLIQSGHMLGLLALDGPQPFSMLAQLHIKHLCQATVFALETARLDKALQDAQLSKAQFVSHVTHELRLPMTSIKGYTDLMRSGVVGPVNEQQGQFLNVIRNNVERMSVLVSDLSDINYVETGRIKLSLQPGQPAAMVKEALGALSSKADDKKQVLEIDIPSNLPSVNVDYSRVTQIVKNMVNNAIRYTPEGGTIVVSAGQDGDFVRVEVSDTGIGISSEDQEKVFDAFFRSEDPAVREEQGWGLGLAVSKMLVELMGGRTGVRSRLGEGSTFWFTLSAV